MPMKLNVNEKRWCWREHGGEFQDSAVSIILIALQRKRKGKDEKPSLDLLMEAESRSEGMSRWQESRISKCKLLSPVRQFFKKGIK